MFRRGICHQYHAARGDSHATAAWRGLTGLAGAGCIHPGGGPRVDEEEEGPIVRAAGPGVHTPISALVVALALAVVAPQEAPAAGGPAQKPGKAGCVSDSGTAGACARGVALVHPNSVAVSPDGKNVYVASEDSNAVAVFDRDSATGALTQKPGTAGCVSQDGTAGACARGVALNAPLDVVVTPDGKSVYVAAALSDAVAAFDRDPGTGALTQKPGTAGCVSETGTAGLCTDGLALDNPISLAVTPDGKNVYAGSLNSDAVAVLGRNGTTGALNPAGCVSQLGTGGCLQANALIDPRAVAVSPDGKQTYVGSFAVTTLDRSTTTGELTGRSGMAGCIGGVAPNGCRPANAIRGPRGITMSPDGGNMYVSSESSNSLAVFDRDALTGTVTQKAGTDGCTSLDGTGGACRVGTAFDDPERAVVSPDGRRVYVAMGRSNGVAILDRDTTTGALTQLPGATGCITLNGTGGACARGVALDNPEGVATSPDGRNFYVAAWASSAVAVFDREAAAGGIGGGTGGTRGDRVAPVLSAFSLSRTRFRVGAARTPVSARVSRRRRARPRARGFRLPLPALGACLRPHRPGSRAFRTQGRPELPAPVAPAARTPPLHPLRARRDPDPRQPRRRSQHDPVQRAPGPARASNRHLPRHDHRHRPGPQPFPAQERDLRDRAPLSAKRPPPVIRRCGAYSPRPAAARASSRLRNACSRTTRPSRSVNRNANRSPSIEIPLAGPVPLTCATASTRSPRSISSTGSIVYPDSVLWFSS